MLHVLRGVVVRRRRGLRAVERASTVRLLPGGDGRLGDRGDDLADDVARVGAVGDGVEGEQQAVAHHVGGDLDDVGGQHVGAAAQQREGPAGGEHAQGGARADAELDGAAEVGEPVALRGAGGDGQVDQVGGHRVVDEEAVGDLLEPDDVGRLEDLLGPRRVDRHPVQDRELLLPGRVRHVDLEQEAVALGLGQAVDTLGLDRVLGGEHEERVGQGMTAPGDGDLFLGHRLEQGRLHLGRGPVDLVGEHEVGEDRAALDVERLGARPPHPGAGDVAGHQVGGELQAREAPADHVGQRAHRQRLGHAGHAFEQQVAAGQQPDEHPLDHRVLPDDDLLDLHQGALEQMGCVGDLALVCLRHGSSSACACSPGPRSRRQPASVGVSRRRGRRSS